MTPAPDTGRTAEEMREQIARFWWDRVCPTSYVGRWNEAKEHSGFFKQLVSETYEDAGAILSGPLAQLASEAAHLRAENANLRDRVREAEKALKPFADEGARYDCPRSGSPGLADDHDIRFPIGAFRAADKALAAKAAPLPDTDTGGRDAE